MGCRPWGHKESDTTERLHFHFHFGRKTCKDIQTERVEGEKTQMCLKSYCHPGTERFTCLETCEAREKLRLEIGRRQTVKGFLCPVKQLELYLEGLRESLMDLFNLFPHDYKINICLF